MAAAIPSLDPFTLAMSAAGAIISIQQAKSQKKMIEMGRKLEQASFETNLAASRAEYAQSSLAAMQELRQNIGNQIAINAARGVQSGAGSAAGGIRKSEQSFASDEKARRMNLLTKENQLRAGNVLSGLHTLQSETKLGQSLTNQLFNTLPISGLAKTFGVTDALEGLGSTIKAGFGLKTIGTAVSS